MKKTFNLVHPKIKIGRLFDASRFEVKKYIKRERAKALPKGADFWDFDCRFGDTKEQAKVIHPSDINKHITDVEQRGLNTFYLEILAKPATRTKKPKVVSSEEPTDISSKEVSSVQISSTELSEDSVAKDTDKGAAKDVVKNIAEKKAEHKEDEWEI